MSLLYTTIAQPDNLVVSVAECKMDLRIEQDFTLDDDLIESYIIAASRLASEIVGRKLINETIKYSMSYGMNCIVLPFSPVQAITEIQYFDENEDSQTMDINDFYLYNFDDKSELVIKSSATWPSLFDRRDALNITFTAGYGTSNVNIPKTIIRAIRLMVANFYENRSATVVGVSITDLPFGVQNLLNSERRGWVA